MARGVNIDGVLVTWGDRLFYPGNRVVKGATPPKLTGSALRQQANSVRNRIAAIVRRAPQVMVKVTGGGRNMRAIAAHFRYISKNGRLDIEDDRGETMKGPDAVRDLADDWRFSGSLLPEEADGSGRREAFNIMLSMPRGTDPLVVQRAARAFARAELAGHKFVMVLHDHQANPHVHISVRAESRSCRRLNPRKADLARWRENFAEKLRDLGIEAEATQQAVRGGNRVHPALWQIKARKGGRLRVPVRTEEAGSGASATRTAADQAWAQVGAALSLSDRASDLHLARKVTSFLEGNMRQRGARARSGQQPEAHRVSSEVTARNR